MKNLLSDDSYGFYLYKVHTTRPSSCVSSCSSFETIDNVANIEGVLITICSSDTAMVIDGKHKDSFIIYFKESIVKIRQSLGKNMWFCIQSEHIVNISELMVILFMKILICLNNRNTHS
jgi:hypothetical protein